MEMSLLLAKILGPFMAIVGIGLLLHFRDCQKLIQDFSESPALLCLGGTFTLILGLFLVNVHGIWEANWTSWVTLLCWLILVKGIILIISPGLVMKMSKAYENKSGLLRFQLYLEVALGLYLTYQGYVA